MRAKWSDQGVLTVVVADNGSGISAEAAKAPRRALFSTKGQAGTGLGLWVTRSILSRYGGSLHIRSSVSQHRHGTVFSVFIPTYMRPVAVVPAVPHQTSHRIVGSLHFEELLPQLEASHMKDHKLVAG